MTNELEATVLKDCLNYLNLKNIFAWRQNSGAAKVGKRFIKFTSINGISDIIGICPDGRFLAVECKRYKGGKVSEEQKKFQEEILKNNGVALIVNSVEELIGQLKIQKI